MNKNIQQYKIPTFKFLLFENTRATGIWLKYCRYGIQHKLIHQLFLTNC